MMTMVMRRRRSWRQGWRYRLRGTCCWALNCWGGRRWGGEGLNKSPRLGNWAAENPTRRRHTVPNVTAWENQVGISQSENVTAQNNINNSKATSSDHGDTNTDKQEKQHHRASLCPFVFALRLLCAFPPCVQVFTSVWCGVTLMNRVRAFDHFCQTLSVLEMKCIGQMIFLTTMLKSKPGTILLLYIWSGAKML